MNYEKMIPSVYNYPLFSDTANTFDDKDWIISFLDDFHTFFIKAGSVRDDKKLKLIDLIRKLSENYCTHIKIETITFMVTVLFDEKKVILTSPKASTEMLLCEIYQDKQDTLSQHDKNDFKNIKLLISEIDKVINSRSTTDIKYVTAKYDLKNIALDDFNDEFNKIFDSYTEQILSKISKSKQSFFDLITNISMAMISDDEGLKNHLLKFVIIFPFVSYSEKEAKIKNILIELTNSYLTYLKNSKGKVVIKYFFLKKILSKILLFKVKMIPSSFLYFLIKKSMLFFAKRFLAEESIFKSKKTLKAIIDSGRDITVDNLGELVLTDREADRYVVEVLAMIDQFERLVPIGELNSAGLPKANVSIKISALCFDFRPYAFEYVYEQVAPRLIKILKRSKDKKVFINIDAEHFQIRDAVLQIYHRVLIENDEFADYELSGIVLQGYLKDASEHLDKIINLSKDRGIIVPVRLVKGAYWDVETTEFEAKSEVPPQFLNKEETDIHYRQLIIKIFENNNYVRLLLGSHNYSDHCFAEAIRESYYPQSFKIEHQCLDKTYEALSIAMTEMGWCVRNYVPIGDLIVGMGYLVRRILENSSQMGVLNLMRHNIKSKFDCPDKLFSNKIKNNLKICKSGLNTSISSSFVNTAGVELYKSDEFDSISKQMDSFRINNLGLLYFNHFSTHGDVIKIYSPSNSNLLVGEVRFGTIDDVDNAVRLSQKCYLDHWGKTSVEGRVSTVIGAANKLLINRSKITSLIVYEAGKTLEEAIADVDEAIDFIRYYCRQELAINERYNKKHCSVDDLNCSTTKNKVDESNDGLKDKVKERSFNHSVAPGIKSRGTVAVISPWNFPVAIPCGMITAALSSGNTVILKSAEQTPLVAQLLVDLFHQSGVPYEALIHLPGVGETVGDALVGHKEIAGVLFTGSKKVGLEISHKVKQKIYDNLKYNISYPSFAISEMGGKNAAIVSATADLDEVIPALVYSAFAHSGQKCSALSRIIIDNKIKDKFTARFVDAVKLLVAGDSYCLKTYINPLITRDAKNKLITDRFKIIDETLEFDGEVLLDSNVDHEGQLEGDNNMFYPLIVELPFSRAINLDSWTNVELFAPVVHIVGVDDLSEAIELHNNTNYALTSGIFSQLDSEISYLRDNLLAGSIYINRNITGARVAIEPFGGFKLSGTGPKAGGENYLKPLHLFANELGDNSTVSMDRGSDYNFYLCSPVMDRWKNNSIFITFINLISTKMTKIFTAIRPERISHFEDYEKWIVKNLGDNIGLKKLTKKIPGQQNYNDYSVHKKYLLFVEFNERPYYSNFIILLSALASGVGVTVICRGEASFRWWNKLKKYYILAGGNIKHFDIYYSTNELLVHALRTPCLSTVVLDGSLNTIKEVLPIIYKDSTTEKTIKRVITPYDAPDIYDYEYIFSMFTNIRTVVQNTVRYGAVID